MAKHGKKYTAALAKVDIEKIYTAKEAVALAAETSITKFDSTIEVHMRTTLDSRQSDQQLRDVVVLPHGLGKKVRVLVFAQADGAAAARAGGHRAGRDHRRGGDLDQPEPGLHVQSHRPKVAKLVEVLSFRRRM